jgi:hypothetical protein
VHLVALKHEHVRQGGRAHSIAVGSVSASHESSEPVDGHVDSLNTTKSFVGAIAG